MWVSILGLHLETFLEVMLSRFSVFDDFVWDRSWKSLCSISFRFSLSLFFSKIFHKSILAWFFLSKPFCWRLASVFLFTYFLFPLDQPSHLLLSIPLPRCCDCWLTVSYRSDSCANPFHWLISGDGFPLINKFMHFQSEHPPLFFFSSLFLLQHWLSRCKQ